MKTEWKIFLAGLAGSAVIAAPSWLPVFGITPEWFGSSIVKGASISVPFLTFAIGVLAGWNAKERSASHGHSPESVAMRRLKLLDAEQLAIVMDVYERGKVKVSADFDTGVREGLEKMGILDVYWHYMGAGSSWSLKDDYRQTIDKHGKSYFIEQARKGSK